MGKSDKGESQYIEESGLAPYCQAASAFLGGDEAMAAGHRPEQLARAHSLTQASYLSPFSIHN